MACRGCPLAPRIPPPRSISLAETPTLHGVCNFAEDPARPADIARLFWHPDIDPTVIVVDAVPTRAGDREAFDVATLPAPALLLTTSERCEELLIGQGPRAIRLSVATGTLREGPVRLAYRLAGTDRLEWRLRALGQFASFVRDARMPPLSPVAGSLARRRMTLLRVLDALVARQTHRGVAADLFGEALVRRDWTGTSDYLRSRTHRLVRQARAAFDQGPVPLVRRAER